MTRSENLVFVLLADHQKPAKAGFWGFLQPVSQEAHGLREPRHRVNALERTLAWFDRFLK